MELVKVKMNHSLGQSGVMEGGGAGGEQGCVFLPDCRELRIPTSQGILSCAYQAVGRLEAF